MSLCWKCRKGWYDEVTFPWAHCHHTEPEVVKPKCWCEREGEKRMQVHDYIINGHYQMRGVEIAQYCPYCGKVLRGAV